MGIGREPRVKEMSAAESRCQATTGKNKVDKNGLVWVVENCRVCELAIALHLRVVTICM
jgi:hypothetical protein